LQSLPTSSAHFDLSAMAPLEALAQSTDDESLALVASHQSPTASRVKAFVGLAVFAGIGLTTAFASSTGKRPSSNVLEHVKSTVMLVEADTPQNPSDVQECDPLSEDCSASCGDMTPGKCDAPGWVFCQNAICDEKVHFRQGVEVAKCNCWQPTNTNESILPATEHGGGSCVLGNGMTGTEMCEAMKAGALFSTYGPKGDFLPGKPMRNVECPAHNLWAWCWGAPCEKDAEGKVVCDCPIMRSTNNASQVINVAGDAQCIGDPCTKGWTHNAGPAGTVESNSPCPANPGAGEGSMPGDKDVAIEVGELEASAIEAELTN